MELGIVSLNSILHSLDMFFQCTCIHMSANVEDLLKKSAKIVQIDIDKCVQAKRLHGIDKHKRDLIVYLLWNKGLMTNEKLGQLFNMSYSAISHCVKRFKEKMNKDKKVKNQFEKLNSQFKL